jgi:hypothetical protein
MRGAERSGVHVDVSEKPISAAETMHEAETHEDA